MNPKGLASFARHRDLRRLPDRGQLISRVHAGPILGCRDAWPEPAIPLCCAPIAAVQRGVCAPTACDMGLSGPALPRSLTGWRSERLALDVPAI